MVELSSSRRRSVRLAVVAVSAGSLIAKSTGDKEIVNTWVATDNVRTVREVWEQVRSEGYNVSYHRVPVSRDQSPEDRYLDTCSSFLPFAESAHPFSLPQTPLSSRPFRPPLPSSSTAVSASCEPRSP